MYETDHIEVPASQADAVLSTEKGFVLKRIIIVPATKDAGVVSIKDGSGSAIILFVGGTDSLLSTDLKPIVVDIDARCSSNGWKVTTGANVSVIAVGRFV